MKLAGTPSRSFSPYVARPCSWTATIRRAHKSTNMPAPNWILLSLRSPISDSDSSSGASTNQAERNGPNGETQQPDHARRSYACREVESVMSYGCATPVARPQATGDTLLAVFRSILLRIARLCHCGSENVIFDAVDTPHQQHRDWNASDTNGDPYR